MASTSRKCLSDPERQRRKTRGREREKKKGREREKERGEKGGKDTEEEKQKMKIDACGLFTSFL